MVNNTTLVNSASLITNVAKTTQNTSNESNEFATMLEQISYENSSKISSDISAEKNTLVTDSKIENKNINSSKEDVDTTKSDSNVNKTVEEKLDVASEVSKTESEIKETLMEKLDVTEEELENALENLGISLIDCLDTSNLAKLMVEVSGSDDMTMILTDETMFMEFTEISETLSEISDELLTKLGMTKEEFANFVLEMKEQLVASEESQVVVEQETVEETNAISENLKVSEVKNETDVNTVINEITSDEDSAEDIVVTKTGSDSKEYQSSLEKQYDGADDLAKRDNIVENKEITVENEASDSSSMQDFSQKMQAVTENNDVTKTNTTQQTVSQQEIFEQINSQIKLSMNADETKMQFQLNPETLGKVTVQVAVKAGVVTAQLAAENQAVKEALEGQIVQLKDSLNNQGLKVEAVEVTIESHEFERNLEENEHNRENLDEEKHSGRKQLNYKEIDDIDELSDEEALIAEMMIGNGNSINYTA